MRSFKRCKKYAHAVHTKFCRTTSGKSAWKNLLGTFDNTESNKQQHCGALWVKTYYIIVYGKKMM